jgi:hypothetical protein
LAAAGLSEQRLPSVRQRLIRVTEPVVAKTMGFRFAQPWKGLEEVKEKGSLVASDGDCEWRTPYDNCIMVMPSVRHLKPGNTMVRLGRYE